MTHIWRSQQKILKFNHKAYNCNTISKFVLKSYFETSRIFLCDYSKSHLLTNVDNYQTRNEDQDPLGGGDGKYSNAKQ